MSFGPQPVRTVTAPSVDAAVTTLARFGFHEHERTDAGAVLKKPGRSSFRAHQRPLEVRLRAVTPGEVELELRYDQFMVLDSGDLARHADRLAGAFG